MCTWKHHPRRSHCWVRSLCPEGHHFLLIPLSSSILGSIPAWEVETTAGSGATGQGAGCPTWAQASQLPGTKTNQSSGENQVSYGQSQAPVPVPASRRVSREAGESDERQPGRCINLAS